jgi:hypothetical protein
LPDTRENDDRGMIDRPAFKRTPPLAGLKAMSSPNGFFSGKYSRASPQRT